jgi:hypothetical protein
MKGDLQLFQIKKEKVSQKIDIIWKIAGDEKLHILVSQQTARNLIEGLTAVLNAEKMVIPKIMH